MESTDPLPPFLSLPSELIYHVLSFLSLSDLLSVGLVSRTLQEHAVQDSLFQLMVNSNVPGKSIKPSGLSWRELYKAHHPYWFIPRNKVWFSDSTHTGQLLIARYDHRINAIEAYSLVAERRKPELIKWDWNTEAMIHSFSPKIQLDLNVPVIRLDAYAYSRAVGNVNGRLQKEIPMNIHSDPPRPAAGLFSRLMLTRPWPSALTGYSTPVWPPLTLPSVTRTRNDSSTHFRDIQHRPSKFGELSSETFRLRKWMEFAPQPPGISLRIGENITTWGTLPEEYYTPTREKPWQGIWCGDYAGHGCEFLAILQPDAPDPLPERAVWALRSRDRAGSVADSVAGSVAESVASSDSWSTALMDYDSDEEEEQDASGPQSADDLEDSVATLQAADLEESFHDPDCVAEDEKIYRGRIEAVKLTGDPNIPRGQYTFIAPDIGLNGLVRVASEDLFKGARIVRSVGHIAANGFRDDDYVTSQLILISHDRIAQYWETFGHVSFYQRVNIDEFTKV